MALLDDLTAQLNAEIESSVARAVAEERARARVEATRTLDETRRRLSESLNQTLRRLRQTSAEHETLQLLLEDSTSCAERAVVLLVENNQASVAAWRGVSLPGLSDDSREADGEPDDAGIVFGLDAAAAIASCAESRDPVVSLAEPGEISPVLAAALSETGTGKVYLFPIAARQNTVALLLACGAVTPAPIELLCEAAGMKLESFAVPAAVASAAPLNVPLVQIAGASRSAEEPAKWSNLTPEEQALHLRAQRTARVRVAQIRISESEALRKGAQAGDIYGALRQSIDDAREEYHRMYISQSPTMVDYLHLEVMRSLAHDDSRLLGQDYPGPIA